MVGVPINVQNFSRNAPLDYVWDPDALTSVDAAQAGISRLLTADTEQVEGGCDHTCLHGCYHRFSLLSKNPVVTMPNAPPKKYLLVLYFSPLLGNLAIKGLVV